MTAVSAGKRILIVEDEIIIAMDIAGTLRRLGYAVIDTVSTGEEVLGHLNNGNVDLVLMDVRLSGEMDGIEVADLVRCEFDVPIVFLTAHSDNTTLQRVKKAEPYGYLTKPVHERDLLVTIETSLYRYRTDRIIRVSESRYRSLFEQSADAICICHIDGTIIQTNEAMRSLSGYDNNEIVGIRMQNLFPEEIGIVDLLDLLQDENTCRNFEIQVRRKDGRLIDCKLTLSAFFEEGISPSGLQCILRDVTSRKKAEREKEALLHKLSERVKELDCLYNLTELNSKRDITIDEMFSEMALIIPLAWQNPDRTCVKITLGNKNYFSMFYRESENMLRAPITSKDENYGAISVYYHCAEMEGEQEVEKYFSEKRSLLNSLARRMAVIIEYIEADKQLQESHDRLRDLSGHLQTVREEERSMIAREIHDELGQALTALKMDVAWMRRQEDINEKLDSKLLQMSDLIDSTIDTVRKISANLRPGMLDDLGLMPVVEWFTQEFEQRNGISCKLICNINETDITPDHSIAVYRILQESMTNILRHANASSVEVSLIEEKGKLKLSISDNGKGISEQDLNKKKSFGIVGMKERAYFCDGELKIESVPGKGTKVLLSMPLGVGAKQNER